VCALRFKYKKPLCLTVALLSSGVYPTSFSHLPQFDDYRAAGEVITAYAPNHELATHGVTLKLKGRSAKALAAGVVHKMGRLRGYGRYVIVDHGHGWHTLYSNLGRLDVAVGDQIARGQVLGEPRAKRLFLVVSFRGNPINPSEVYNTDNHKRLFSKAVYDYQKTT